jgi:hypothetical protein
MAIEKIYNIKTGETTERELSKEALKSLAVIQTGLDAEAEQAAIDSAAKTKLLERLGITAEEAKLLLK